MKAVSLWQPWATLIALGVKTVETRSWQTSYRGELAIHAAKHPITEKFVVGDWEAWPADKRGQVHPNYGAERPARVYCNTDGIVHAGRWAPLPLGMIVATCTLIDIIPTDLATLRGPSIEWFDKVDPPHDWERFGPGHVHVAERQRPYGDYGPGRFAWLLDDIKPLPEPVPARGRQQLFDCDVVR